MKKIIFIIIIILIGSVLKSQSTNNIIFDNGYYYGYVEDSLKMKYIFMYFVSGGEDMVYIKPYIIDKKENVKKLHDLFIDFLDDESIINIDGNILDEQKWTISGFDNCSYYTLKGNAISYSLNIADINSQSLHIFDFCGKISSDGDTISSLLNSTEGTFNNDILFLKFKELE